MKLETSIGIIILLPICVYLVVSSIKKNNKKRAKQTNRKQRQSYIYYVKRKYLLTKRELSFYKILLPIANNMNMTVMSKVRLADLIEPPKGHPEYMRMFNKIKAKHIDFVLCSNDFVCPIILIELDDSTHDTQRGIESDRIKNEACISAGVKLIRFRNFSKEIIEKKLYWIPENF